MIAAPPMTDTYIQIFIFGLIPIIVTAIVTFVNMTMVYVKVRRQFAAGKRWRLSRAISRRRKQSQSTDPGARPPRPTTRVSLDHDLFWQCVLYLGAFYTTWIFMCMAQVERLADNQLLWSCICVFAPLQGFFNFLVYIRPRILKVYRAWRVRRWDRRYRSSKSTQPTHILASATQNTGETDIPVGVKEAEQNALETSIGLEGRESTDRSVESEFDDEFFSTLQFSEEMVIEFSLVETENDANVSGDNIISLAFGNE